MEYLVECGSVGGADTRLWTPYRYGFQNPLKYIDPTRMSENDHAEVTDNKDGTYTVVGGVADKDKSIYVVDEKGKRTGEIIGKSLTTHSFHNDNGEAVKGAVIDTYDVSGINFLNLEIIKNKSLSQSEYMPNATGGEHYDFKARGRKNIPVKEWNKYHYREMLFQGVDGFPQVDGGNTIYASARDIGNVGAGYFLVYKDGIGVVLEVLSTHYNLFNK